MNITIITKYTSSAKNYEDEYSSEMVKMSCITQKQAFERYLLLSSIELVICCNGYPAGIQQNN